MTNPHPPPDKMRMAGEVLAWLTGFAVVAMLVSVVAFWLSNSEAGAPARIALELAPWLRAVTLGAETGASLVFIGGVICWRARVWHSRLWMICAGGVVLVSVAIVVVDYLAVGVALSNP